MLKKGGNSFHFIGWKLKHKMVSRLTQTPVISMGLIRLLHYSHGAAPAQLRQDSARALARQGRNAGGSAEYGMRQQRHC